MRSVALTYIVPGIGPFICKIVYLLSSLYPVVVYSGAYETGGLECQTWDDYRVWPFWLCYIKFSINIVLFKTSKYVLPIFLTTFIIRDEAIIVGPFL